MGRRSKVSQTCIQNFGGTTSTSQSQKARVDDITGSEEDDFVPTCELPQPETTNEAFEFIVFDAYESESDSDYNSECTSSDGFDSEEEEEEDGDDVKMDADLLHFSATLAEAQAVAIKMESDRAEFQPKWGKRYTGNSACTKHFHVQKWRTLQAEGQKFISHWFTEKKAEVPAQGDAVNYPSTSGPIPVSGSPEESNEEPEIIDIEEHMERIFLNNDIQEIINPSVDSVSEI